MKSTHFATEMAQQQPLQIFKIPSLFTLVHRRGVKISTLEELPKIYLKALKLYYPNAQEVGHSNWNT